MMRNMKDSKARKAEDNAKVEVINHLLGLTRILRKKGDADKAIAAAQYEKQFEEDLAKALAA